MMKTYQNIYRKGSWESPLSSKNAQLVLLFGDRTLATNDDIRNEISAAFPAAEIVGCTTSGEISGNEIYDDSLCLTGISFESSSVSVKRVVLDDQGVSSAAKNIAKQLDHNGLKYVLVLSDGQKVNGTDLIRGLKEALPANVCITGGLAGDGTRFQETIVWHNEEAHSGQIVVCGFYGPDFRVGHGSMGGWDPFGPERLITKSKSNVLYTLDEKPALELYKSYLDDHAKDLPSSALLFPLLVKLENEKESVIRTILNINEEDNSMIFAGDVPEGATAQLMRANFDRLIDGAEGAAETALKHHANFDGNGLALLISCVGRRLVLNQRVEEELESVHDVFGDNWSYTGFYSYGEISPVVGGEACALHNQTMTITTIFEQNA